MYAQTIAQSKTPPELNEQFWEKAGGRVEGGELNMVVGRVAGSWKGRNVVEARQSAKDGVRTADVEREEAA